MTTTEKHAVARESRGVRGWRTAFAIGAEVLLAGLAWALVFLAAGLPRWGAAAAVGLLALPALISLAGEALLGELSLVHPWRSRLALLAGFGLPALGVLAAWLSHLHSVPLLALPAGLLLAFTGAFAGSLAGTVYRFGWAENNLPPGAQVCSEVEEVHARRLGTLPPTPWSKRAFDIAVAGLGLLLSAPVWALSLFMVWWEDPGPVLFVKNSVGKGGRNFHQYKFRTMICQAERATGPVLAQVEDQRVLNFGWLLRKTALDELPQLLNILRGEMSFVGPRPQRTVLVHGYLQRLPEYAERHRVLPGLAGLAQVAGDYYLTPRQKLRFDRLYIGHASLGFDLKLLGLAFLLTFWYRWHKSWNGRLPRKLLR